MIHGWTVERHIRWARGIHKNDTRYSQTWNWRLFLKVSRVEPNFSPRPSSLGTYQSFSIKLTSPLSYHTYENFIAWSSIALFLLIWLDTYRVWGCINLLQFVLTNYKQKCKFIIKISFCGIKTLTTRGILNTFQFF